MPKARNKTNATLADLDEARDQLKSEIGSLQSDIRQERQKSIDACKEELRQELRRSISGAEQATEEGIGRVVRSNTASITGLQEEIQALRQLIKDGAQRTRDDLQHEAREANAETRRVFAEELQSLCVKLDEELTHLRGSLEALVGQRASEAEKAREQLRADLEATAIELRLEATAAVADSRAASAAELAEEVQNLRSKDEKQDKEADASRAKTKREMERQSEHLEAKMVSMEEAQRRATRSVEEQLAASSAEAARRQKALDEKTTKALHDAYALISDVENVPTKSVDWIIKSASQRLKPPKPSADDVPGEEPPFGSWVSPRFDAAGARDLQIELRVFRPTNPPTEGQEKGDCTLILRAPKGTNIACRLSVGSKGQEFEKKFDYDSEELGTERLCFIEEQINPVSNRLRVSIEVLESICEVEKVALAKQVTAGEDEKPLDSSLFLHRHVNNRVLQQVRAQVEHLKSRTVRRVEWRLEEASRMRRAFPRGAPMFSREFDAAGVQGLQLVFYPSGHDSASDGFCSVFLAAPGGATVHCHLQAGPERRELRQTWDQPGQFGRANFCRFESCIEAADDTVLLLLDIEDAHQDIVARLGHFPPPAAGIRSLAIEDLAPAPLGSIVKLHRGAERLPQELQEVKVLPSIAATRNRHSPAARVGSSRSCGGLRDHKLMASDQSWRRRKLIV